MRKEFVSARYQENMGLTVKLLPDDVDLVIYNKGGKFDLPEKVRKRASTITSLRNVGREAHTYLHHLVENYDDLADITMFSQADVKAHLYGHTVGEFFDYDNPDRAWSFMHLQSTEESLKYSNWNPHRAALPPHINAAISHWGARPSDTPFSVWWDKFVKLPAPTPRNVRFSWGGVFSITRAHAHQYSKGYYKKLLKALASHPNPEEGHFMERAWSTIFKPLET